MNRFVPHPCDRWLWSLVATRLRFVIVMTLVLVPGPILMGYLLPLTTGGLEVGVGCMVVLLWTTSAVMDSRWRWLEWQRLVRGFRARRGWLR